MDGAWIREVHRLLLEWFDRNGRELPWRSTSDPYAIWVSEIMLQQTQVATVIPYYKRFLDRFQTVAALAEAEEAEVLRLWEGLGYYRRAKQLHAAARRIVVDHAGKFPVDFESILKLPGIGRYTAGAICSFALNQPYPIVEANTQRLYARLCTIHEPLSIATSQATLWRFAERMVELGSPAKINQAMMELGSQICKPNEPDCDLCPIGSYCATKKQSLQCVIPVPKEPKLYEDLQELVVLLNDRKGRWLLRRCQTGEWWSGLWDFPRFDITSCKTLEEIQTEADLKCRERFGRGCKLGKRLKTIRHAVTRYRITLHTHYATWQGPGRIAVDSQEVVWLTSQELLGLPLSSTGRKISDMLGKTV